MSRNPMLVIGFAASLALGVTAAQAQTSTAPNAMSHPSGETPSMNGKSGMNSAGMSKKAGKAEQNFLKEAIEGDLSEVNVGKLAQQNGESQDVKQFGQTLQQDHSQNLQQAQALAQQVGVTPPTEPSAKEKKIYERLSKERGERFDKAFAKAMVKDHKQDIAKFDKQAKKKDAVGQFAQQTLPTLHKHLKIAQSLTRRGEAVGSGRTSK
jgi:putative membrane protein